MPSKCNNCEIKTRRVCCDKYRLQLHECFISYEVISSKIDINIGENFLIILIYIYHVIRVKDINI